MGYALGGGRLLRSVQGGKKSEIQEIDGEKPKEVKWETAISGNRFIRPILRISIVIIILAGLFYWSVWSIANPESSSTSVLVWTVIGFVVISQILKYVQLFRK